MRETKGFLSKPHIRMQHTRTHCTLIGQSLKKTIRTIKDKNMPSRGEHGFIEAFMNKLMQRNYNLGVR